jgi:cobalamin biosynthetic protein CobC
MSIDPHGPAAAPAKIKHGGDLAQARRLFPGAPEPFIDLSTGINPYSYPVPDIPADCLRRLPEPDAVRHLAGIAAQAYGVAEADCVVPAPGTQILLPMVAALVRPGRAAVVAPTYAEHARAAQLAGHEVSTVHDIEEVSDAALAVVVNPNNPDGRIVPRANLLRVADRLARQDGLLVVDEAFADVAPAGTSVAGDVADRNIVVLRSVGKFYGLAGLRLGFALARRETTARLEAVLGPWAVSGAALHVGAHVLADAAWRSATVPRLVAAAARLDRILSGAGLVSCGGTSLFRLTRHARAFALFDHMARAGILVRRFEEHDRWLRFGLPADEEAWRRVQEALTRFASYWDSVRTLSP